MTSTKFFAELKKGNDDDLLLFVESKFLLLLMEYQQQAVILFLSAAMDENPNLESFDEIKSFICDELSFGELPGTVAHFFTGIELLERRLSSYEKNTFFQALKRANSFK